jgi:hypothetical protein
MRWKIQCAVIIVAVEGLQYSLKIFWSSCEVNCHILILADISKNSKT